MNPFEAYLANLGDKHPYAPVPNFGPFFIGSGFNGSRYFGKWYETTNGGPLLITSKQNQFVGWLSEPVFTCTSQEMLTKALSGNNEFKNRRANFESLMEKTDNDYEQETYAYLKTLSTKEAQAHINALFDRTWEANAMVFFCFFLDKDLCQKTLSKLGVNIELDTIWDRATISSTPSFETIDFVELAKKRLQNPSKKGFLEYAQCTACSYVQVSSFKEIDAQTQGIQRLSIDELKEKIQTIEQEWQHKAEQFETWKQSLTQVEQTLVDYLQTIIFLRDARKHLFRKAQTIIWRLGQILTEPLGISSDLLPYITRSEITGDLNQLKEHLPEIQKRPNGFVYCNTTDGREYLALEANLEPIETELNLRRFGKNLQDDPILKGQPASPGTITGKARVILHRHDFDTFQTGEILVTGMTRPEFVPLMKKAAAVVTDEGGITCHAAIVSRELGIPCVIGTKKGTRWVDTGTIITVDGTKGTITKNP